MDGAGPDTGTRNAARRRRGGHGHAVVPEPLAELAGRLSGERADQGVVGIGRAVPDTPGGPEGEDPGLAGPGAGDDAERLGWGVHRPELGFREIGHGPLEGAAVAAGGTRRPCFRRQWFHGS